LLLFSSSFIVFLSFRSGSSSPANNLTFGLSGTYPALAPGCDTSRRNKSLSP
jgi:hypothetical protein